jgi:1-deoxy-D-xylulose-5-phosphate synthase
MSTPVLDRVVLPADLKALTPAELRQLADDVRHEMIHAVGQTGATSDRALAWWN